MNYSAANARIVAARYIMRQKMTKAAFAEKIGVKANHLSRWFKCETNGKSVTDRVLAECAKIRLK